MKNRILLLFRYIHHFHFLQGLKLFIQLSFLKVETIKLNSYGRITLRKNSSDVDMFNQIFLENEYDIHLTYEPKFIIDAGANIGLTSLFFSRKFSLATIISIEPDMENFHLLQKNTSSNSNIISINKALWVSDVKIFLLKSHSYDSHNVSEMEESSEVVEAITVSTILDKYKIETVDILKIDVEGAEKEIFSGNFQNWLPKIKILVIELHDRFKPGCSMSLFKALNGYNYSLSIKGELLIINFN